MTGQPLEVGMAHLQGGYQQIELRLDGLGTTAGRYSVAVTSLIVVTWITTILAILLKR